MGYLTWYGRYARLERLGVVDAQEISSQEIIDRLLDIIEGGNHE
jgi:hypothetical protein